ncbi:hypothetical protein [Synechocystis sp. PCC 7509]|uniref:hypothetical protein n=1 Tax=Synechocystis sp. PCC 7509 TaxID=927677 RepID=UPI0002AD042A|nr:hypothetical protein [Synechocystis sp. PCC 7509]
MLQGFSSSKVLVPLCHVEKMLSETEDPTPIYKVEVINHSGIKINACLEPAKKEDMPPVQSLDFTFAWREFWQKSDFDCEAIIKLSCQGEILGLIRFGLYPYGLGDYTPEYIEVLHLQCVSKERRSVNPVGFWLLWYAIQIGFSYCIGETDGTLLKLDSLEDAIPYYRDKVKMDGLGWINTPSGEANYAFKFTQERAKEFCIRIEQEYGYPVRLG